MKKTETYQDLKKEKEKLEKALLREEDDCARRGIEFQKMIEQTIDLRKKINKLSQQMRLLQEPSIVFDKEWKGDWMKINDFIVKCKNEQLDDSDGYGYYATENGKSNIKIFPSDVIDEKVRTDFSHVIWFSERDYV